MSKKVTAAGASRVAEGLDRLANTVEKHASALGIPADVARDFVARCDHLSDAVEKKAGLKPGQRVGRPLKANESGSFPGQMDAAEIGETKSGPLEVPAGAEKAWMNGHFTQAQNEQLAARQEAGKMPDGTPVTDHTKVYKLALAIKAAMIALGGEDAPPEDKEAASKRAEADEDEEAEKMLAAMLAEEECGEKGKEAASKKAGEEAPPAEKPKEKKAGEEPDEDEDDDDFGVYDDE